MGSGSWLEVKRGTPPGLFAQAPADEFEAVGIVDEAIEDGVGEGGIADDVVPSVDRELAGDDGRLAAVPVLEDLQEIAAFAGSERGQAPVVEDQQ